MANNWTTNAKIETPWIRKLFIGIAVVTAGVLVPYPQLVFGKSWDSIRSVPMLPMIALGLCGCCIALIIFWPLRLLDLVIRGKFKKPL
jgi:hypothetical protein